MHDSGIQSHLDYLVVVGQGDITECCRAIWSVFGTNFDWDGAHPGFRGHYYEVILKSAQGIEIAFNSLPDSPNHGIFRISIPGAPLQHVRQSELHKLGRYFLRSSCRCTRFDWAIDDHDYILDLDEIVSACQQWRYSGAKSHRYFQRQKKGEYQVGRTIYLGSSQSDKQVRIYDKNVESKGAINSIRYEIQWRDGLANAAFEKYFSIGHPDIAAREISINAVGAICFYESMNDVLSRSTVLPMWSEFIKLVGGAYKLSARRIQPLISDKIRWIESQVGRTLAIISKIKGFDDTLNWLERLMRESLSKMPNSGVMYIKTWFDRLSVERGKFEDWMVVSSWETV
jgi:DNA relaxase NicK